MRLSHRLSLVFSLFGLVVAGGFQYRHVRIVRQESYARAENMAEVTLSAVRSLVEAQAKAGRFADLGRNLELLVRQAGIAQVAVVDLKGRRLLSRTDEARLVSRTPHPGVAIGSVPDGIFDVEGPAFLGPKGRGRVQVGLHMGPLESRLDAVETEAVQSAVTAFLAITLAAWLLGASFGLRLERLVPRIETLPRDPERFRPLKVGGFDDEVSRLEKAFNDLGASLKSEMLRRREAEAEKRELSAMLVHDLKTPLTVIRSGMVLLQEQINESPRHMAKTARKAAEGRSPDDSHGRTFELLNMSTDRLRRMVEDVLQLSRMEEVQGLRETLPVDLAAMARACAKDFGFIVEDRKQSLALEVLDKDSFIVSGDGPLLRRVLDNLVHNAVEHTPAGGTITLRASLADEGLVRVSVSDSGPGIPLEARGDIFRKFFQKDTKRYVGNVGLGLALCEKAVLRHGGAIGIEDAAPRGACFYFTLPLAPLS